jgi:peptide/nickel transport system substrate-binding protein
MSQRARGLTFFSIAAFFALMVPLLIACGGTTATPTSAPAATAAATTAPTAGAAATATTPPAAAGGSTAAASPSAVVAGSPTRAGSPAASPGAAASGAYPSGGKFSTLEPVGKKGGHATNLTFADAKTNNPMLSSDTESGARIALQYNVLVDVNPDNALPFPDLATEVPNLANGGISKDGLTYTFKLRKDVKWSDNQPFTSKDVVFTYQTMAKKELGSPRTAAINERIDSVSAPDDATVVFKLKKVVAPFLISNMYAIVPEHILKDVPVDQIKTHPFSTGDPKASVATGPFKFKEWVKDDHATFEKNPLYFRGEPALDQVIHKVVKDQTVVVAQLKTGEGDWGGIQESFFDELSKDPKLNVAKYDTFSFTFYSYQLDPAKSTLFQQKEVRQALAYALDRDAMIKAIRFGIGQVAQGTMPVPSWAYAPDQITTKYTYDPKKAEQLLDQAGWAKGPDGIRAKGGQKLSFTLWTNAGNKVREQYVTVMQQQWKAIGVDATPKTEEWNAFLTRITETHDFEVYLVGFQWDVDPDQTTMWSTESYEGGFNMNKYSNKKVDELMSSGLSELDQAKRKQLYVDMQNVIMDELPNLIIDFPQGLQGVNKRVHNLKPNAVNTRWNAHTWWVDDGK